MKEHLHKSMHHIAGLFRTRVVVCIIGLFFVQKTPSAGQWIVSLCGMAVGVSAIGAWKGDNGVRTIKRNDD